MNDIKQNKRFKPLQLLLFMCSALLILATQSFAILASNNTVAPSRSFYVTDTSQVLDQSVAQHILSINLGFEKTVEKPQIAIVTVPTLNGVDINSFAVEQFQKMGLGNKQYDNGILLVLATSDRQIRIEVGYGLEGILNDAKVGRIIDASMNELSTGNYSKAINDIFNQLVLQVQQEYGFEDVFNGQIPMVAPEKTVSPVSLIITVVGGFLLLFVLSRVFGFDIFDLLLIFSLFGNGGGGGPTSGGGGGRSGGGGSSRNF